jgi:hypothetical protein
MGATQLDVSPSEGAGVGAATEPVTRRSGARDPSTRDSASTNGLPGPDHAQLAASYQRFTGFEGHNLTELRTDEAERDEDGVRFQREKGGCDRIDAGSDRDGDGQYARSGKRLPRPGTPCGRDCLG